KWNAARCISKESAIAVMHASPLIAGAIAGGESPEILAITFEFMGIVDGIFTLNANCLLAVLKIITALGAHERILDQPEIDPRVGILVSKKRPGIQDVIAVDVFPLVSGGPGQKAFVCKRKCRRAQAKNKQKDGFIVAFPTVMEKPALRFPSLRNSGSSV